MGRNTYVSSKLEPDDKLSVNHHPARPYDLGGEIPEAIHIGFGDVSLWGSPAVIATVLDQALTRVQSIMDDCEEENG